MFSSCHVALENPKILEKNKNIHPNFHLNMWVQYYTPLDLSENTTLPSSPRTAGAKILLNFLKTLSGGHMVL